MKTHIRLTFLIVTLIFIFTACKSDKNKESKYDPNAPFVSETWQKWIRKNSFSIKTSSVNNDLDFLQKIIGERTLIQLGESSHGVKEFNQIRVRIIKYLHEKMGFNVIAFESGLFECYNSNISSLVKNPGQMIESIFSVWRTEEVLKLFEYIIYTQDTDEPLSLAGFDFQMSGDWTERSNMLREIASLFDQDFAYDLYTTDSLFALTKKPNDIKVMRKYVEDNQDELKKTYTYLKESLEKNMEDLTIKYESNPLIPLFAHQISVSMLAYIDFWLDEENEMSIRDKAMADNVIFLKNKAYPDEKIIIWAHNFHIRHNNQILDLDPYEKIKTMGAWLHESYSEDLYTVGLYMYKGQGAYTNKEVYNVKSHSPNSLEAILHSTGNEICFVDFKNSKMVKGNDWMVTEIVSKTWGLHDIKIVPKNQYDAILFIDSVSAPNYLE